MSTVIKKRLPYFKIALFAVLITAAYLQYGFDSAAAHGNIRPATVMSDEQKVSLFENDPDALARSLNEIEPSK